MTISVNYNPSVLKTQRNLSTATNLLNNALERMSTGFKVNSASDDAAGLYVATNMNTQIRGLKQANKNVSDGISLLNTASGSLDNMKNILNRLRDLSVQASNGVYSDEARAAMQNEVDELTQQIYQIKNGTNFNGKAIFGEAEEYIKTISSTFSTTSANLSVNITQLTEKQAIAAGYTVIKTADDLDKVRNNLSGKYILMGDIDLSGYSNWDPIGKQANPFTGTFDGNGYKISNLKINRSSEDDVGLFGNVDNATFKNVGVENASVVGRENVGGLIGNSGFSDLTTVENCYAKGIIGTYGIGKYVGGLVGSFYGEIKNSYAECNVFGVEMVGVLAGAGMGEIKNCYANGSATGDVLIGGIVGAASMLNMSNSYASSAVTGSSLCGSLVGNMFNTYIENCFWNYEVSKLGVSELLNGSIVTNTRELYSDEIMNPYTYIDAGWSETDWWFDAGGMPKLAWQKPKPPTPPQSDTIFRLQVGPDSDENSAINVDTGFLIGSINIKLSTVDEATISITNIDELLEKINSKTSDFGAVLNRLDSVYQSNIIKSENLTASKSTIMDSDIAMESAVYVKNQILQRTSSALLTQSQSLHKNVILGLIQ